MEISAAFLKSLAWFIQDFAESVAVLSESIKTLEESTENLAECIENQGRIDRALLAFTQVLATPFAASIGRFCWTLRLSGDIFRGSPNVISGLPFRQLPCCHIMTLMRRKPRARGVDRHRNFIFNCTWLLASLWVIHYIGARKWSTHKFWEVGWGDYHNVMRFISKWQARQFMSIK